MRRVWLGRLIFTVMLVAVLAYLALGPRDRLEISDMLASVGALLLGATALVLSVNPVRAIVINADTDGLLANDLATLVQRRWAREAALRLLRRPDPLTVTWSTSTTYGDVTDLAAFFDRVPARRLVIVGAAGSGKTVAGLLLTLDLLAARGRDEPVPVFLPVASWDPDELLDTWLARRLAEEHPALADRHRYGPDALARLVRGGGVLPVLDGLDEMPARRRPAAIAALNIAMAGRPVLLTCRSDAFADAVSASGMPLDGAAVVDLEPLTATAAAAYLPAGQIDGERRWAQVVAELLDRPNGTVARALSTPLMVYLARTVYAKPGADPADLTLFDTAEDVEAHLLDRYLPAIYGNEPVRAEASLAYLAGSADGDIAWWDLLRQMKRWRLIAGVIAGTIVGFTGGLVSGLPIALVAGSAWGLPFGLILGLYTGIVAGFGYASLQTTHTGRPRHLRLNLHALLAPTRTSLLRSLQCGIGTGMQVGGLAGVAIGFRQGAGSGIAYGVLIGLLVGIPAGLLEYFVLNLTHTRDEPEEVNPRGSLAGDRRACLMQAATGALLFGLSMGATIGMLTGARTGILAAPIIAVAAGVFGILLCGVPPRFLPRGGLKWTPYTIARLCLAAHGRIPWRLLRFLEEAHSSGILHQDGAVYRFRHARVREHLAAKAQAAPAKAPGSSGRGPDRLVATS